MSQFREHFLSKLITLLTLVFFLNISFSALEINLLGLKKDVGLSEIVSFILSGTFLEEERDIADDFPEEASEANETELFFRHQIHTYHYHSLLLSDLNRCIFDHALPLGRDYETLIPPPERLS
jgi:hypothetical protein